MNIRQDPSPYFSSRGNWKISGVVIHTTVGNYLGTLNWFKNNLHKVSAHYVVREDGGEITQMVDEDKAAHHAGLVSNPTTKVFRGSNPNFYTIGIENADAGQPHSHIRTGQHETLGKLVRAICQRHGIAINRDNICGHREIYDKKTCPGNIDVDLVVRLAQQEDNMNVPNWFENLLKERNLSLEREGEFREFWGKAIDYDSKVKGLNDEIKSLKEQVKSANEALADRAYEVSALTEKNQKLTSRVDEIEELINQIRGERDKATWEKLQLEVRVGHLEDENERLLQEIERHKKDNSIMAYAWIERFISLFKRR